MSGISSLAEKGLYSKSFDKKFYLRSNPDLQGDDHNPKRHYDAIGHKEDRWPNQCFDPVYYRKTNPDAMSAGTPPFQHYQEYGWRKGRQPCEGFWTSSRKYLTSVAPMLFVSTMSTWQVDESQTMMHPFHHILSWFYHHSMRRIILILLGDCGPDEQNAQIPQLFDDFYTVGRTAENVFSVLSTHVETSPGVVLVLDGTTFMANPAAIYLPSDLGQRVQIVTVLRDNCDDILSDSCSEVRKFLLSATNFWVTQTVTSERALVQVGVPSEKVLAFMTPQSSGQGDCVEVVMRRLVKALRTHLVFPPLVSVVTCVYNQARFVEKRMKSILSQSMQDLEIVVLDDCSTDGSWETLQEYVKDPLVSHAVRNAQNSGKVFQQWKRGVVLSDSRSKYVWIAEGDDFCSSDFLQCLLPYFNDPNVVIASGKTLAVDENERDIHVSCLVPHYHRASTALNDKFSSGVYVGEGITEIQQHLGTVCTLVNVSGLVLHKASLLRPLDRVREFKMCGDYMIYLLMLQHGKLAYDSRTHNFFRRHAQSVVHHVSQSLTFFDEMLSIILMLKYEHLVSASQTEKSLEYLRQDWQRMSMSLSAMMTFDEWLKAKLTSAHKSDSGKCSD